MYFTETIKNERLLERKKEEQKRSLSTREKLIIAEDVLKTTKDRVEYQEVEETIKELNKTLELEQRGFIEPQPLLPKQELDNIFEIANQEAIVANEEYQRLKGIVSDELQKYLTAVGGPLLQMLEIERGANAARLMSYKVWFSHSINTRILPFGGDMGSTDKIINTNNRLKERVGLK